MKCKHECKECDEAWECKFPYFSEYQYFKTSVNNGYYCNAFCPACKPDERKEVDEIFKHMSKTGYVKSSIKQIN
jgi:hypothetical protein